MLWHKRDYQELLGHRLLTVMDENSQQSGEAKKVDPDNLVSPDGAIEVVRVLRGIRGRT